MAELWGLVEGDVDVIDRQWLGWSNPALPLAAQWLVQTLRHGERELVDLSRVMCIVPGQRAGRLLLAELLKQCDTDGVQLVPPAIHTPGQMVDVLAPHREVATATDCEQILSWSKALRQAEKESLWDLLPFPPDDDAVLDWYQLAQRIARLHEELAGNELSFADVADQAGIMSMEGESRRWGVLDTLHKDYQAHLAKAGLVDPHEARSAAIKSGRALTGRSIVLIGVVDLNAMQRSALSKVADQTTALIHAPEAFADRFDDFGCVEPAAWQDAIIEIDDDRIVLADRSADQAQAAMRTIAGFDGKYAPEDITLGIGDETLADVFAQSGRWAGITFHNPAGEPLRRSAAFRLWEAGADWLSDRRFAHLAALLRHPDLEQWLRNENDEDTAGAFESWQTLLDEYFTEFLQSQCTGNWLGSPQQQRQLARAFDAVNDLFSPLAAPASHTIQHWCKGALEVLHTLYVSDAQSDQHDPALVEECGALRDVCTDFASAAVELCDEMDGATALQLFLTVASTRKLPQDPRRGQIEMLGWFELHLDTAPALIVTGFNEGCVPQSLTADAFLPDSLRRALGMTDNARRYARDAYLFEALLNSRQETTFILSRHSDDGEPLTPSRLLFACPRSTIAHRVELLCGEHEPQPWVAPIGIELPAEYSRFNVPQLIDSFEELSSMPVTWFRDYLVCPYRFALRRLMKLKGRDDNAAELDAGQFGSLAHDVLRAFGVEGEIANCTDAERIASFLDSTLRELVTERYGNKPMPAVLVQMSRLRQRLERFAEHQAQRRAEGWRIDRCEYKLPQSTVLEIPGQEPMHVTGRVDRIDRHEATNEWCIIDYKTSESAKTPEQAHRGKNVFGGDWIDVQLPLYQYLAAQHGIEGEVHLAYFNVPKDPAGAEVRRAKWDSDQFQEAIDTAQRVVREIRAGRFEMNQDMGSSYDDFSRICRTTAFVTHGSAGGES